MKDEKEEFCDNVRLCQDVMYRLSYSILKNNEDTKDAVAETILKAYEKRATLKDKDKFKPWIMRILSNTSYDVLRKRDNVIELTDEIEDCRINREDVICNRITVIELLDRLDYKYREVIMLYYYEDMSIKEISSWLNLTEDNVKKRLSRGREKLKKFITYGEETHGRLF